MLVMKVLVSILLLAAILSVYRWSLQKLGAPKGLVSLVLHFFAPFGSVIGGFAMCFAIVLILGLAVWLFVVIPFELVHKVLQRFSNHKRNLDEQKLKRQRDELYDNMNRPRLNRNDEDI